MHAYPQQATNIAVDGLLAVRAARGDGKGFALVLDHFCGGPGDRIGLVGRSGSGKSTILESLGLLIWLDSIERFVLCGESLAPAILQRKSNALAQHRARYIGFVPQDGGLLPYLSVRENAALAAKLAGQQVLDGDRLAEIAEGLGIAHLLDRPPARLSGGEKQRASVLRAMVTGAKVILADEPTAALDAETADEVMDSLTTLGRRLGITLICASHDLALLRRFGFDIRTIQHFQEQQRTLAVLRQVAP